MPRNPKLIFNGDVLFITTSVEEGFMFPPNPMIKLILLSCLARAQMQHKVTVCHFLIESTHIHLIIVVENPCDVKDFMKVFKSESAHAVNRLLGRKKKTVWCEGFDNPRFLNPRSAAQKIVYLYENPSKDNLEESIEKFPGLSSWSHFRNGEKKYEARLIPRDAYSPLPEGVLDDVYYKRERRRLSYKREKIYLEIEPDAWMKALDVEDEEVEIINEGIVSDLREKEKEYELARAAEKKGVLGARRMALTPIGAAYQPERRGRKTLCIGEKDERKLFMAFARHVFKKGRAVLAQWRDGNYRVPYPVGLYPPSMVKQGNLLGEAVLS